MRGEKKYLEFFFKGLGPILLSLKLFGQIINWARKMGRRKKQEGEINVCWGGGGIKNMYMYIS